MPSPITVTVNWDTTSNGPVVSKDPITVPASNGATVIQWSCGSEVQNFQITGLDTTEFTYPASTGPVTVFTATDQNTSAGTYPYTVTATHQSGRTGKHDPEIENGGGIS